MAPPTPHGIQQWSEEETPDRFTHPRQRLEVAVLGDNAVVAGAGIGGLSMAGADVVVVRIVLENGRIGL